MRIRRLASVALMCTVIVGCGGGGTTTSSLPKAAAPLPPVGPALKSRGTAKFVIEVPTKKTAAVRIRRGTGAARSPRYVSVATQSVSISTSGAAATVANLNPSSPNCTPATATTPLTCTIAVAAAVGYDTFAVAAYDGQNGTGNVLSQGTVGATISGVAANTVAITLDGVIAATSSEKLRRCSSRLRPRRSSCSRTAGVDTSISRSGRVRPAAFSVTPDSRCRVGRARPPRWTLC